MTKVDRIGLTCGPFLRPFRPDQEGERGRKKGAQEEREERLREEEEKNKEEGSFAWSLNPFLLFSWSF